MSLRGRCIISDTRAAAAVEFAAVAPLIVLVMLTIIYFGLYISVAHSVQQLATDGARASVAGLGDPERRELTIDYVTASASEYFLIEVGRVEVDVVSGESDAVAVTVSYDATPLLAWYPVDFGERLSPTIVRSAAVRAGGY